MRKRSKRYRALVEKVGTEKLSQPMPVAEAARLLKEMATTGFPESVDVALNLNIDPRQSDQLVRGNFSLPHGTGKSLRVIAFAEGDAAKAAKDAGAVEVGDEDLAKKVQDGWLEFDVAVAHPSMMKHVGKLGKVLGPKGLMPSPKSGTVTPEVATAVKEFAAGKIEFRNDAQGAISVTVGTSSFEVSQIEENINAFISYVRGLRPVAVKGAFFKSAYASTTMSPGLQLAV